MPWPVYSERFIDAHGPAGYYVCEVPENTRAIVTELIFGNPGGIVSHVQCLLHGLLVYNAVIQAAEGSLRFSMRQVVYERESITAYYAATGINVMISGYLFADTAPAGPRSLEMQGPFLRPPEPKDELVDEDHDGG